MCVSKHYPVLVSLLFLSVVLLAACSQGGQPASSSESSVTGVPEVNGLVASDAVKELKSYSNTTPIEITVSRDGQEFSIDATDSEKLQDYTVASLTTEGSGDDSAYRLAVEMNEDLKDERRAVIQKEIDDSLKNGWASEEYYDGETMVVFRAHSDEAMFDEYGYTNDGFNEVNEDYYKDYALQLKSDIVTCAYTSDGYMSGICYVPYDGLSDAEHAYAATIAVNFAKEADDYVYEKTEDFAESIKNQLVEKGWHSVEYSYDANDISLFIYSQAEGAQGEYDEGWSWTGTPAEQDQARKYWSLTAEAWTTVFARNVTIKFYTTPRGVEWDSFSAEKHEWLPEDVFELAKANKRDLPDITYIEGVASGSATQLEGPLPQVDQGQEDQNQESEEEQSSDQAIVVPEGIQGTWNVKGIVMGDQEGAAGSVLASGTIVFTADGITIKADVENAPSVELTGTVSATDGNGAVFRIDNEAYPVAVFIPGDTNAVMLSDSTSPDDMDKRMHIVVEKAES